MSEAAFAAADQDRLHDWLTRASQDAPQLAPLLESFGAILAERARLRADLFGRVPRIAAPERERLLSGVPVLLDAPLAELTPFLEESAARMLPAMAAAFPALVPALERLAAARDRSALDLGAGLEALLRGDGPALEAMARAAEVEENVLRFALGQVARPVLECAQEDVARAVREAKWLHGRCPSCGAAPDLAVYMAGEQEQSEFLKNHGGQRWLRCSLCGMSWRFKRVACPECGSEEPDDLQFFTLEGRDQERAHACSKCKRYLVGIDVREMVEVPDLDVALLAMLPLEILIQEKGFQPLAATAANTL